MFKQRKYALRKVSGIGLASCCIGVLLFLGGSPISADETSVTSSDTVISSSEVSDLKDKTSDSMSNIQESTVNTDNKTNDEPVEDKNTDTELTTTNESSNVGALEENKSEVTPEIISNTVDTVDANNIKERTANTSSVTEKPFDLTGWQSISSSESVSNEFSFNGVDYKVESKLTAPFVANTIINKDTGKKNTYSFNMGNGQTSRVYGSNVEIRDYLDYYKKEIDGKVYLLGKNTENGVEMVEVFSVGASGELLHEIRYFNTTDSVKSDFKFFAGIDTMLNGDDRIPIVADGKGGVYISNNDITIWGQPIQELKAYAGHYSDSSISKDVSADNKNKGDILAETGGTPQGKATLSGAVYTLSKKDGTPFKEITFSGTTATVTGIPFGEYVLKEKTAPNGYSLDTTEYPIIVKESTEEVTINKTVSDTVIKGSIRGFKTGNKSSQDGTPNVKLSGVELTVTSKTNGKKYVTTTKEDGSFEINNLPYDDYTLAETKGKEGYRLIEPYNFSITAQDQVVTFNPEDKVIENRIKIVKKDKDTGKVIKVEGTQFKIWDKVLEKFVIDNGSEILTTNAEGYYVMFWVLLTLALRKPELYALRWKDIDFTNNIIHVEKSLDKMGNLKNTKGNKRTDYKIDTKLAKLLKEWKEEQKLQLDVLGIDQGDTQFLFTYTNSENKPNCPLYIDYLNNIFKKLRKSHPSLPNINPHKFRHTAATLAMRKGRSIADILEGLTHSDTRITQVYLNANNVIENPLGAYVLDRIND